jgi:3alpha(or 20beta)-hydroxysteroid dehydrogenase
MTSSLLDRRRVVITGGANGIGAAVAERFAYLGASGVVLDLPSALRGSCPAGWSEAPLDVTDEQSMETAMALAVDRLGGIDGVVAAAGVVPSWQHLADLDLTDFDRVLAINAHGVASAIKHAAPLLANDSTITVVASLNSWRGDPNIMS